MNYSWLIMGVTFLAFTLPRVVAPRRFYRDPKQRIAEIEAGAPERYFEEYRALKAYPKLMPHRAGPIWDYFLVAGSLALIAMGIWGKAAIVALLG